MQAHTFRRQNQVLIVGTIALAVSVLIAMIALTTSSASATSLVATTNISADGDRLSEDPITSILAETNQFSTDDIIFLEMNILMPGDDTASPTSEGNPAGNSDPVVYELALPWGENPVAY